MVDQWKKSSIKSNSRDVIFSIETSVVEIRRVVAEEIEFDMSKQI